MPFFFKSAEQKKAHIMKQNTLKLQQEIQNRSKNDALITSGRPLNPFFIPGITSPRGFPSESSGDIDTRVIEPPIFPEIAHIGYSDLVVSPVDSSENVFHLAPLDSSVEDEPVIYDNLVLCNNSIENTKRFAAALKPVTYVNKPDSGKIMLPWTSKYSPPSHRHIFGNIEWISFIFTWLCKWKYALDAKQNNLRNSDIDIQSTLLIRGPSGIGKTASIYACCQELGFSVIEINPSSSRSGSHIKELFSEAMQSHRMKQLDDDTSLILFEEIDIVFPQDRGFYNSIFEFIETSKRPIILTCNNLPNPVSQKILRSKKVLDITLTTPSDDIFTSLLSRIFISEGISTRLNSFYSLSNIFNSDIRFCMNNVQFWYQILPSLPIMEGIYKHGNRLPIEASLLFKDVCSLKNEIKAFISQKKALDRQSDLDLAFLDTRICDVIATILSEDKTETIHELLSIPFGEPVPQEKPTTKDDHIRERDILKQACSLSEGLSTYDFLDLPSRSTIETNTGVTSHKFMNASLCLSVITQLSPRSCLEVDSVMSGENTKRTYSDRTNCHVLLEKLLDVSPLPLKSRKRLFAKDIFPFIVHMVKLEDQRKQNNTKRRFTSMVDWRSFNITEGLFNQLLNWAHLPEYVKVRPVIM